MGDPLQKEAATTQNKANKAVECSFTKQKGKEDRRQKTGNRQAKQEKFFAKLKTFNAHQKRLKQKQKDTKTRPRLNNSITINFF